MGHKGPVLRPRCIGPGRARTEILFYSILFHVDRRTGGHDKASSHFSQFRKEIMKEHTG